VIYTVFLNTVLWFFLLVLNVENQRKKSLIPKNNYRYCLLLAGSWIRIQHISSFRIRIQANIESFHANFFTFELKVKVFVKKITGTGTFCSVVLTTGIYYQAPYQYLHLQKSLKKITKSAEVFFLFLLYRYFLWLRTVCGFTTLVISYSILYLS
jgi:hypothetical protein